MNEVVDMLSEWHLDIRAVRERMYRAPTARERERWHAIWLLAHSWSAAQASPLRALARRVAEALERDPHTIGDWVADLRRAGPLACAQRASREGLIFEQTGGSPPSSTGKNRPG